MKVPFVGVATYRKRTFDWIAEPCPAGLQRRIHVRISRRYCLSLLMNAYALLACAIALEVLATSLLKASDGMTRLWPTLGSMLGYGVCFWLLSIVMKTVPTGIAYAIWSGVGIVLISLIGLFVFKQKLDLPALVGIGLICAGVVVINVFSRSTAH